MIPFNHSRIMITVRRITNLIDIVVEDNTLLWLEHAGSKIATSKSNTRNRIITRKNLVENEVLFLVIELNPHSKDLFFSIRGVER